MYVTPGTICEGQNASISFSAKKLSTFALSTMRPTGCSGNCASGHVLVTSRGSKSNACSWAGSIVCTASVHSGKSPAAMAL